MKRTINGPLSTKSKTTIKEIFDSCMWSGRTPFDSVTHADIVELVSEVRKPENGLKNINWVEYQSQWLDIHVRVYVDVKEDGKEYAIFRIGAQDTSGQAPDVHESLIEYPIALDEGNI